MSEPTAIDTVDARAVTAVDAVDEHVVVGLTFFAATTARYLRARHHGRRRDRPTAADPDVVVPTLEKDVWPGFFRFNATDRFPTHAALAEVTFPV